MMKNKVDALFAKPKRNMMMIQKDFEEDEDSYDQLNQGPVQDEEPMLFTKLRDMKRATQQTVQIESFNDLVLESLSSESEDDKKVKDKE